VIPVAALAVLALIPGQFAAADLTHDGAGAARVRTLASILAAATGDVRLERDLRGSAIRLQPWPLPQTIRTDSLAAGQRLRARGAVPGATARPYDAVRSLLSGASSALARGDPAAARLQAAGAYALFALGPERRLVRVNTALASQTDDALWRVVRSAGSRGALGHARAVAETDLETAATALGDVSVSRATVIADAGVIVFREGLEAVLILAAITASFTGARRGLRRPVLIGGLLGLLATAVTYELAQTILAAAGDGGLRLQAITGLLAIAVLLLVTNWFFHRVYWSEWIGRFNRRRKVLEQVDRFGFISGQALGFVLLVDSIGWRSVFLLNVPVAILVVSLGVRFIPVIPRSVSGAAFDWTGAFLTTAGVGVLTFGIIEGPSHGWGSGLILGAFVVGFCALAAFVAWERRHESPLIDVSLFSRVPFTVANLAGLAVFFAFIGGIVYLSAYFQQVQGRSPLGAGLAVLPVGIGFFVGAPLSGRLVGRLGPRLPMVLGLLLCAAGMFGLVRLDAGTSIGSVWWDLAAVGLGGGLSLTPMTATAMAAVRAQRAGMASRSSTGSTARCWSREGACWWPRPWWWR
jgi:MFS family permease